jgi:hypothetical protein
MRRSIASRRGTPLGRRILGFILITGVFLALSAPGSAQATCLSSVPNNASFADDPADAGVAPEITGVTATLNASCGITINPEFSTASLDYGDGVVIAIDADGNPATGDPDVDGADTGVITVGDDDPYPDFPPELFRWDGFEMVDTGTTLPLAGLAGFSSTLDQIGVPAPATIGIVVASLTIDDFGNVLGADFAPEVGAFPFAASFSSPPPPPPPPPGPTYTPPAPTPASPSPPVSGKKVSGCVVPHVKGSRVSRAKKKLRRAGCKYRIKGHGKKVRSTSPTAGTRTAKTVIVRTNRRKRSRKSHSGANAAQVYQRMEQGFAQKSGSR